MTSETSGFCYVIPAILTTTGAAGSAWILTRQALRRRPNERSSWASDLRALIKGCLLVALWSTLALYWLWLTDIEWLGAGPTLERGAHWPQEGAGPVLYWLWALAVHFLALCVVGWSGKSATRGAGRMVKAMAKRTPGRARKRKHAADVVPLPTPRGRGDEPGPAGLPQKESV